MRSIWLLGIMLASAFLVGCDKILYGEDTTYSNGFSEAKFKKIKHGMSVEDVVAVLGRPLNITTQQWSEVWSYMPPGTGVQERGVGAKKELLIIPGPITRLQFSEDGVVESKFGDYLKGDFAGLTKRQVEERLGKPSQSKLQLFEVIYRYSMPGDSGNGNYKKREIHFDKASKVSSIVVATYYD